MENLIINERDREFLLFDMLELERIFESEPFEIFDREQFKMALDTGLDLAWKELYPTLQVADRQGCRLQNGNILVPKVFYRLKELFNENAWSSLSIAREDGGQGFSTAMYLACCEPFAHNPAFYSYLNRPVCAPWSIIAG